MQILKVFILGWTILVAAIAFNAVASRLGLVGWYDLLAHNKTRPNIASLLWLFLIYPLSLGTIAWLGSMLLRL